MNVFFLLLVPGLAQCFPVTAHQGGNCAAQLFYCTIPECASNVGRVFCNDKLVMEHSPIAKCTGAPAPNTVCQQGGLAFVCSDANACEFEGKGYIETKKCTDHSNKCSFLSASPSPQAPTRDRVTTGYIIGGVVGAVLVLILVLVGTLRRTTGSYQFAPSSNQEPASNSDVAQPLRETSNSDTQGAGPGLDGGPPSQCGSGA